jgi:plastocyanin
MKSTTRRAILLAALGLAACHGVDDPKPPVVEVFTPGNTFSPFSANVNAGGVVRFNIFGDEHNVIFTPGITGAPADIQIVRDQIVDRTFPRAGDYPYSCTVHPGMNGEIIVR